MARTNKVEAKTASNRKKQRFIRFKIGIVMGLLFVAVVSSQAIGVFNLRMFGNVALAEVNEVWFEPFYGSVLKRCSYRFEANGVTYAGEGVYQPAGETTIIVLYDADNPEVNLPGSIDSRDYRSNMSEESTPSYIVKPHWRDQYCW